MTSFTDLPAEIRNTIYEHLFRGAVIEDLGLCPSPIRTKNYHLAITTTNRQIRAESLSVLELATTLHFRIGQSGAPLIPNHVLRTIRTIRIPAHRLKTLDTASFALMETLVLDVSIDPALWKLYQSKRSKGYASLADVSDMIHLSMSLGIFEHSWDVEKVWRDKDRKFKMLCWISSWVREDSTVKPVLIDIDKGLVLAEGYQV
jgi:hypothetical protein